MNASQNATVSVFRNWASFFNIQQSYLKSIVSGLTKKNNRVCSSFKLNNLVTLIKKNYVFHKVIFFIIYN